MATIFGVFTKDNIINTAQRISLLQQYNNTNTRVQLVVSQWPYASVVTAYNQLTAGGITIELNLEWMPLLGGATAWPTGAALTTFLANTTNILDTLSPSPPIICVGNEELGAVYHLPPITDYIAMMQQVVPLVHSYGLLITNGGLRSLELSLLVYYDYLDRGMTTEAALWKLQTITGRLLAYVNHPTNPAYADIAQLYADALTLIAAYATLDIDYVNIHIYEPYNNSSWGNGQQVTSGALQAIVDYILDKTGKDCISNEMGQFNYSDTLVTSMLEEITSVGLVWNIWYDGDGSGLAIALHNLGATSLRDNGKAYAAFFNAPPQSGTAGNYKLSTTTEGICDETTIILYTDGAFAIGKVLYYDIILSNFVTGYTYVTHGGYAYALNSSTGVIGSITAIVCGSGTPTTVKLGTSSLTVCANSNTTVYTSGAFAVGKFLFSDSSLSIPLTGYTYVVVALYNAIYSVNSSTGEILALVGYCVQSASVKLGNNATTICDATNSTVYTAGYFEQGKIAYTDALLTTPLTGYAYIVNNLNNNIYNVNSLTGQIGSYTNRRCTVDNLLPAEDDFSVDAAKFIIDDCGCETRSSNCP
jgi:hypothetical protein